MILLLAPKTNLHDWFKEIARSFSKWALFSIVIIGATGVWMSFKYVPSFSFQSLIMSFWGQMLFAKILLFAAIVVIGYWQRKNVLRLAAALIPTFRKFIIAELSIAAVLLLLAGILVDLSPEKRSRGFILQNRS